ncbi:NAD(P)/FAD-dependent oxidoreductase [Thermosipho ferrireducens]|uniref:NAD(P)/FAD-dependent oxidoreductase n=1 Tax=Thermosipho ferrireducens TaxID=2571116 RepID=A0ABX7S6M2_9BACT|nr:NAD(P)/FAD-dependent oxidoreductase [Thermosipho ferrireducens]QTA37491.1 NAD(P)/FAD-dependent oxidoreductase [Thermosipho ferrireducens]
MAHFTAPRIGIVGAGPAGISAGIFLKRYNFNVTIFEKKAIGGLISNAWRVENIPIMEPASGETIVNMFKKYISLYNVPIIFEEVLKVTETTITTNKSSYKFDEIIIASGTNPKRIQEFELCDKKIVYEFRDLPDSFDSLAIYGAGDVAFDGAIKAKLSGIRVHIFNRSKKIRALERLVSLALKLGVVYHEEEPIIEVTRENNNVILKTSKNTYKFNSMLIAIGRTGNTDFVKTKSVYVVGDAAHPEIRQASIAIGDGIKIAMKIIQKYKNMST